MSYDPFKCPDCSVWWRGETHKCATPEPLNSTTKKTSDNLKIAQKKKRNPRDWIYCPSCEKPISKYDWHTCKSYDKLQENYRNRNWIHNNGPEDHDPPRWNA